MAFVKLSDVEPSIGTVQGDAHYVGTEVENLYGKWNDHYSTRDGYWVVHEGKYHHVYKAGGLRGVALPNVVGRILRK